jgi:NADPH2:quinone reductase
LRAVPAGELIPVPDGLGLPEAAALAAAADERIRPVIGQEYPLAAAAAAHAALESRNAVAKTLLRA